ncbi:5'-methylthioadenosine/adenosylhomocysteine nucleosidase [Pelagibius litoralis]|uniref:adenosylhomocysteine nucleosidase n=1 Tax=Pelagibius litoralis TaxID=374515 RepID=A0A967F0F0_9PROT|nr:5'-methylthioadenosine/adenosylhomocysteine nucleosidase [Pelagibius litoralis]NIA70720.1 5'-methylthioadenosine/adenosylhomocysteine nucleosidase [Pelagibius litoralis]
MLAVIGAMDEEVTLLRAEMTDVSAATHAEILVTKGDFKGTQIALAQCGIGKVNAAICTQMLVNLYKPDALVFSGVAGGLLPNMQVGDLVIASHLIQFDIDLTAFGRRHGELPDSDRMIQSDPGLVEKTTEAFDAAFNGGADEPNLMIGTVVSGDRFVEDSKTLRWLQREFGALATEMEGAAVGYTCQLNAVPFVVTRGLSDTANESAPDDFKSNLETVCKNSFRLMERLIPALA